MDSDQEIERICAAHDRGDLRERRRGGVPPASSGEFIESGHPAQRTVVACGGGLVVQPGMAGLLRSRGVVVCLHASLETILARTSRHSSRPLLNVADPEARIRALYAEREAIYRSARDDGPDGLAPAARIVAHVMRIREREAREFARGRLRRMDERPENPARAHRGPGLRRGGVRRRVASAGGPPARLARGRAPRRHALDGADGGSGGSRPELVLPGVRSVILLGVNYWGGAAPARGAPAFARYAQLSGLPRHPEAGARPGGAGPGGDLRGRRRRLPLLRRHRSRSGARLGGPRRARLHRQERHAHLAPPRQLAFPRGDPDAGRASGGRAGRRR